MRSKSRGRRPTTQWIPTEGALTAVAAATATEFTLIDASAGFSGTAVPVPQLGSMTIRRILGQVNVLNTDVTAISTVQMGILVKPAGVTILSPSVQTRRDYPWMFLRQMRLLQGAAAAPFVLGSMSEHVMPFGSWVDVKVSRLLKPDQTLVLAYQASTATTVSVFLRSLISRAV